MKSVLMKAKRILVLLLVRQCWCSNRSNIHELHGKGSLFIKAFRIRNLIISSKVRRVLPRILAADDNLHALPDCPLVRS